jgi:hypothetical protein
VSSSLILSGAAPGSTKSREKSIGLRGDSSSPSGRDLEFDLDRVEALDSGCGKRVEVGDRVGSVRV